MKILVLPKYASEGASSRYRFYQYLEYFKQNNIFYEVHPFFKEGYVGFLNQGKRIPLFFVLQAYINRFMDTFFRSSQYDIIYIQAELFPFMPSWGEWLLKKVLKKKLIVDYDDAIFHNYDLNKHVLVKTLFSDKISKVMRMADCVITGSPYLTQYASKYNKYVEEIPTSIVNEKYLIKNKEKKEPSFVIGWIGSSSTSKYIVNIKSALEKFISTYPNTRIHLIGFNKKLRPAFEHNNIVFIDWSENDEIEQLYLFDVGIMPLEVTPWERGKCGFKLIQYMACGKPTISSPLEANLKINRDSKNLFASEEGEWFNAFKNIYNNRAEYIAIGNRNKEIVAEHYCVEANYKRYLKIFHTLLNKQ